MEKGLLEGILKGIEACLKLKFGAEGLELMPELREIQDHELLGKILDAIETAASPDELRRVWTRKRRSKKGAGVIANDAASMTRADRTRQPRVRLWLTIGFLGQGLFTARFLVRWVVLVK